MSGSTAIFKCALAFRLDVGLNLRAHFLKELVVTQPQQGHVFRQVKLGDQYVALVGAPLAQEGGKAIRRALVIHADRSMADAILVLSVKPPPRTVPPPCPPATDHPI